jgi:hypothetical protein
MEAAAAAAIHNILLLLLLYIANELCGRNIAQSGRMINNRIANGTKIRQSHFHGRATKPAISLEWLLPLC